MDFKNQHLPISQDRVAATCFFTSLEEINILLVTKPVFKR